MKIILLVLLLVQLCACSIAPFIHLLMSFPAVRETFRAKSTVHWLRANIRITDIEIVESLMATINRKADFIRRTISRDLVEADGYMLRLQSLMAKLEKLQYNANLLYCLGICEYAKSIKSDYDPDFSYLKTSNSKGDTFSKERLGSEKDEDPPCGYETTSPSERYEHLIRILSSAEPFEKIAEACDSFDIIVVDAEYYVQSTQDFDMYTVFGMTKKSDAYVSLEANKHILIPENEKASREVEDLDVSTVDSYFLVKPGKCTSFYEPTPLYTNEKKVVGFLRALSRVRVFT
jgi:hypothetical protein